MQFRLLAILLLVTSTGRIRADEPSAVGLEFFEKRIRPLLVENCHACHSEKKMRGGLRLDSRTLFQKGGDSGPVIVPGKPEQSPLIKAVHYKDDLKMPPRGKLRDDQIADLVAWVKMRAPMPADVGVVAGVFDLEKRRDFWSFKPIRRAPIPEGGADLGNPIDAFIRARLKEKNLKPAPEAERRTLVRRLTFDLTGLPPTPEELRAAEADVSPDWYEKIVDRLLASPAHGERWARHWLDLVRYADTLGHEYDFDMQYAFQYRDYVVRALNGDLPYDQFVVEHVAGDLLPKPRRHPVHDVNESIIGTGFFFLGEARPSPVDVRLDAAERIDNQLDVLGKTFLGLTVACARCHDHKFDPISTKDYYSLVGFLKSSRFQVHDNRAPEPTRTLIKAMQEQLEKGQSIGVEVSASRLLDGLSQVEGKDRGKLLDPFPEFLGLSLEARPEAFQAKRKQIVARLKTMREEADSVEELARFTGTSLGGWTSINEAFGERGNLASDAVLNPQGGLPVHHILGPGGANSGRYGVRLVGALRSPTFTIDRKYIHFRTAGRGGKVNVIVEGFQHIREPIYGGLTFAIDHGDEPKWHMINLGMWRGHRAYVECLDHNEGYQQIDRVVLSDSTIPPDIPNPLLLGVLESDGGSADKLDAACRKLFKEVVEQWKQGKLDRMPDGAARGEILNRLLASDVLHRLSTPAADEQRKRETILAHLQERHRLELMIPPPLPIIAVADGTGEDEHVFIRGNHQSRGPIAPRRFLEAIAGKVQPPPKVGSGRLELAQRMTDPSNVLLPRVMVNRLWHHHFGAGLVRTPDDFGRQGELPTHPELLDWLASEFVQQGWSIKAMHRLMVTSATYRQSSRPDPKAMEIDPDNRLLHRYPVRRLEAEAIRDSILAVSGRLDRPMGGPGIMPHITPHMQGRGKPETSGPLDGDGRRSIYLSVRRNFLNPLLIAFDQPAPFTTMGRRSVSNVPAQALVMMNNPFVRGQAELWATRVLAEPGRSATERIRDLYETAFGRSPAEDETKTALEFLKEQGTDDPKAWSALCHVLLNVKEFIFIE